MNKPVLLVLILIFKIILLASLPLYTFLVREKNPKTTKIIVLVNVFFVSLFIILKLFNNSYIVNSSVSGMINLVNSSKYTDKTVNLSNNPNVVEKIITDKIYKTNNGSKVYYFNSNTAPLSDKKVNCEKSHVYFKNVGNNLTSMATLLSTELDKNVDPLELLDLSIKNDVFDCENGVDTASLFYIVSANYKVNIREVDLNEAIRSINTGKIVFAQIDNSSDTNLSCDESNLIIYNINNEGNFNILLPDDRSYDYICPDNTKGYGTVIKANANEKYWNPQDIYSLVTKYYIMER